MITSASYSRLIDFEQCKLRAKMKFVDKIPEPQSPHADRGTQIHGLAEDFVRGKIKKLPAQLVKFKDEFAAMRERYLAKQVSLEGEWGFDADWTPTPWKEATLRVKADAVVYVALNKAIVIDYKTGRRFGNEVKHGEQVQLYAIATLIRDPVVDEVTVELWYIDLDELHSTTYTRNEALRYVQSFDKRIMKMLNATEFPPNPSIFTCQWCAYGPSKGGQCQYGVDRNTGTLKAYRSKFG